MCSTVRNEMVHYKTAGWWQFWWTQNTNATLLQLHFTEASWWHFNYKIARWLDFTECNNQNATTIHRSKTLIASTNIRNPNNRQTLASTNITYDGVISSPKSSRCTSLTPALVPRLAARPAHAPAPRPAAHPAAPRPPEVPRVLPHCLRAPWPREDVVAARRMRKADVWH
jgi:hypothetical protein